MAVTVDGRVFDAPCKSYISGRKLPKLVSLLTYKNILVIW